MTSDLPDHQECDWRYPETYQCRSCGIIAAEMDYPHFCAGAADDPCAHIVCIECWNDVYNSGKHECPLCHKNVEAWLTYNYPRTVSYDPYPYDESPLGRDSSDDDEQLPGPPPLFRQ